jgi:endonuclease/exonuclease/phosphatase family metal-dependent hydrolase
VTSVTSQTLEVLSLNLWNVKGPVQRRMDALAAELRRRPVDLVALQEVSAIDGVSQAAMLADAADLPHVHHDIAWSTPRARQGLAVLSRHRVTALPVDGLPRVRRDQPRILQRVHLDVGPHRLLVANTHLTFRLRDRHRRARQAQAIRDLLPRRNGPRLLLGDLNDVAGSPALRALTDPPPAGAGLLDVAEGASDACLGPTFSMRNRHARLLPWLCGRRVDHVLADRALQAKRAEVVFTGEDAPVVSDHYGLRVTIALPAPGPADV